MFIAALFTIAKLWKQPRCPTTDEWIKKMWYLYIMEFYAAMKKSEMLSFAVGFIFMLSLIYNSYDRKDGHRTQTFMFSVCILHEVVYY
jgi:hypothetical protein